MTITIAKSDVEYLLAHYGREQIVKALENKFNNLFSFSKVVNELYDLVYNDSFVGKLVSVVDEQFIFNLTTGE